MPFLELSFELERADPQAAESACFAHGALSVTLSDERASPAPGPASHAACPGAVLEPAPGEIRLWPRTRLTALFAAEHAAPTLVIELARSIGVASDQLVVRAVSDRAWEREWLRDFKPMRFGSGLWVCPRHEAPPIDGVAVLLDPGLAFGTGTHPSTALCLEWLDAHPPVGLDVIDYGCGSGLLALAALRLGARRAWGYDIDPQALLATRQNAAQNDLADRIEVCSDPTVLPTVGLLMANILSETLRALAPRLAAHVAPRGHVLLSGLLDTQQSEVAEAYAAWFDMAPCGQREGWLALRGLRH
jgi:ribosomal protein L11 methyltransferase